MNTGLAQNTLAKRVPQQRGLKDVLVSTFNATQGETCKKSSSATRIERTPREEAARSPPSLAKRVPQQRGLKVGWGGFLQLLKGPSCNLQKEFLSNED